MLMKDEKKKMASLIVAKALPGMPKDAESNPPESDDSIAMKTAGEELLSAIEQKDASGLVEALKSLIDMLESQPHEENEPSEQV
jgi:hypothetical protein